MLRSGYCVSILFLACVPQVGSILQEIPQGYAVCFYLVLALLIKVFKYTLECPREMLFASPLCLPIPQCGFGSTNEVMLAFSVNRLDFSLPLIPVHPGTQHNAALFFQPRLFSFPMHSQTNYDILIRT